MIRYTLRCDNGHNFDGWFASSEGFELQLREGQVACVRCGSVAVDKAPMAPAVTTSDKAPATTKAPKPKAGDGLRQLREEVERNSDYVGMRFASEARAMHDGDIPGRAIHGEARADEARALIEDGVPVLPLPFLPRRRRN